jgi:hypothetical protein
MLRKRGPFSRIGGVSVRRHSFSRFLLAAVTCCFFAASQPISAQESPHSPGWVVISVDEYRALHAKAYPSEAAAEQPGVDATLTRVDYDLQINGEAATGQASLTVDVLKDGWVRVPIPDGLLVRQAQLDGKPLSLGLGTVVGKADGQLSALLSHPGRSMLLLDIAVPVTSAAASESLLLPATQSGITRATVRLARPEVDVTLGGGLLTDKSEQNRESKWTAYGHGNEPLTFTWRRKTEDHRSTLPLRQRGSLTEMVSLGEDSTAMTAEVTLEILRGSAQEARIQVGENMNINQVSGTTVSDWEVKGSELTVKFLEPIEQSTRFVVSCETHLPRDGEIAIPVFHLQNTERETGGVAVEVLGAGEIKDAKPQGLEEADANDLGEMVASRQSPSLAAYRFRNGDSVAHALSVTVARYTQQAVLMANVEEARYRVLLSNDGKILVQAQYSVRNNQRNFLKVTLPSGASIWSAALSGKPVRPGQAQDGGLLLPLEKARGGEDAPEFAVELVYFAHGSKWQDKGKSAVPLPTLDLPISRTGVLIYYPPLFKASVEPGMFREGSYAAPVSASLGPSSVNVGSGAGVGGLGLNGRNFNQLTALDQQDKDQRERYDRFFFKSQGLHAKGILPVRVSFPAFGPSLFMIAELTSPSQTPTASLTYQPEKKGGR